MMDWYETFGVVCFCVEGCVQDFQVVFVKAIEVGDAGIQFVDQVLLLGFRLHRAHRHANFGCPCLEAVISGGGSQTTAYSGNFLCN